ncbi:MAG: hypothetical protein JO356_09880, partial [Acidobacteria bacterium]|nr:hypothetical protein [Acidobacteriota bacterium]
MSGDHKIELLEPPSGSLVRRGSELPAFYEVPDPDDGPDLRSYWWVVKKRRWTILSALLVVVTLGLIATFKQKPIYRAHALLEIQKENPNILTVQELFQLENVSDNYLETQYKILRSESLA